MGYARLIFRASEECAEAPLVSPFSASVPMKRDGEVVGLGFFFFFFFPLVERSLTADACLNSGSKSCPTFPFSQTRHECSVVAPVH